MKQHLRKRLVCGLIAAVFSISVALAAGTPSSLIPVGRAVGIRLHTEGVMVASVDTVETEQGTVSPAGDAGLQAGDLILSVNGKKISTNEELQKSIALSAGEPLRVCVRRDGVEQTLEMSAVRDRSGDYRLGVMIRDSMSGIGTLTFVDPETGQYGSLGHGICDSQSGALIPLGEGSLIGATVERVEKGEPGEPGALQGSFDETTELGTVGKNTSNGIFGVLRECGLLTGLSPVAVAAAKEIKTGSCTILSNVAGSEIREYQAEITKVYGPDGEFDRCMMIHITDPALLNATGGIVQGMSGSPILQNGKLVGAVTHVLVNDPTRGYGISIESMLQAAN